MDKTEHPLRRFRFCPVCGSLGFAENDFKSKRCRDCGFTYYFNASTSTVAVIFNERGELLVVRRAKDPAKGTLDLPGGFCDMGENAEQGVLREILEETGLEAEVKRYLFSMPNVYPFGGLDIHTLDLFFLCSVGDTHHAVAADDAASLLWIPLEEVRAEDFGLRSVSEGVARLREVLK